MIVCNFVLPYLSVCRSIMINYVNFYNCVCVCVCVSLVLQMLSCIRYREEYSTIEVFIPSNFWGSEKKSLVAQGTHTMGEDRMCTPTDQCTTCMYNCVRVRARARVCVCVCELVSGIIAVSIRSKIAGYKWNFLTYRNQKNCLLQGCFIFLYLQFLLME